MAEYHMLRIRAALYEEIQVAAEQEELSVTAYVARVIRLHLNGQKPKPLATGKPENPAHVGLSPQARAALTKEDTKKAKLDAERRAKAAHLPEFDNDGYEVFRYGITEGWSPDNPGDGYTVAYDTLPSGDIIHVRMPTAAYDLTRVVSLPSYIPERKARDLPDDWESQL